MAGGSNGERIATISPAETRLWAEWGRLTRFLEGARLAFARERNMWNSLELVDSENAKLSAPMNGGGRYKVELDDHLAAVADEEMLMASVLIHSYALAEWAAANHLDTDARLFEGIEDWGEQLLLSNDSGWEDLDGGLAGAVELAITRNAFAHGTREIDARAAARLKAAGAPQRSIGDRVTLDYTLLRKHRRRLRSLLHLGGLGGINNG
jgi:hypothetical protein